MDHRAGNQHQRRLWTKLSLSGLHPRIEARARLPRSRAARSLIALMILVTAAATAACTRAAREPQRPTVAVTVAPQAYVVKKIAGELVNVNVTLPPGVEAHSYEPTLKVVTAIADAVLYVKVGHPKFTFEQAWLDQLLGDKPGLRIVDSMHEVEVDEGDPHVWVAPAHVRAMARNIAAALSDLLPDHSAAIANGLASFEQEAIALDSDIRRTLEGRQGRRFFVFHPAWSYFAEEYGLRQTAIEQEGREPDPKTLATIIAEARAAGV